jgi:hypothetical protein
MLRTNLTLLLGISLSMTLAFGCGGRTPDVAAAPDPLIVACGSNYPCLQAVRRSLEREKVGVSPILAQIMTLLQAGQLPQAELQQGWSGVVAREAVGIQLADGRAITLIPVGTQLPARSVHVVFPPDDGNHFFTLNYVAGVTAGALDARSLGSYRIVLSGKRVGASLSAPPIAVEAEVSREGELELLARALVPEVGPNFTVEVPQVGELTFPTYATVGRKSVAEADLTTDESRIEVGPVPQ